MEYAKTNGIVNVKQRQLMHWIIIFSPTIERSRQWDVEKRWC